MYYHYYCYYHYYRSYEYYDCYDCSLASLSNVMLYVIILHVSWPVNIEISEELGPFLQIELLSTSLIGWSNNCFNKYISKQLHVSSTQ